MSWGVYEITSSEGGVRLINGIAHTDLISRSLASPWRGLRDTQFLPPLLTEQGELLRLFLTI